MLEGMFKKTYTRIEAGHKAAKNTAEAPEGMWKKCNKCGAPIYVEDVRNNFYACPKCGGYFRVHAFRRIEMICDKGSFLELNKEMPVSNMLAFPGYEEKLEAARTKSKLNEAIITGRATIKGYPCMIGVCDSRYMMSSMGHNLGEKVTQLVERAGKEKLPVIYYAASGGARMQEGIVSLMQMAKTSAALKRLSDAGQLFISVLTDPTTGGVTASFAMLGDIILAEPKALIGFAGPRVIEQTIGEKLPEGFQRAEFLLEHGFVDKIVERKDQRDVLAEILRMHSQETQNVDKSESESLNYIDQDNREERASLKKKISSAWDSVLISRSKDRPTAKDYIESIFPDFMEFHGDRYFSDDGAVIGGIATFFGRAVTVIGQQKGKSLKENKIRNFGMSSPEGYRKALRLMKEAEKFNRPIICFVDTPGAFCGLEAEERGEGEAIARNLFEMSALKVPTLSIFIGEGGSGGALGLAVSSEVWMMEHAVYSILSPEGFASILYKDAKKCKQAAEVMKITSHELLELRVVDKVIPEKTPTTVKNMDDVSAIMKAELLNWLERMEGVEVDALLEQRYRRYRKF